MKWKCFDGGVTTSLMEHTNLRVPYSKVMFAIRPLWKDRDCRAASQNHKINLSQLVALWVVPNTTTSFLTVSFPCWCCTSNGYTTLRTFATVSIVVGSQTPVGERYLNFFFRFNDSIWIQRKTCLQLEGSTNDFKINFRRGFLVFIVLLKHKCFLGENVGARASQKCFEKFIQLLITV